MSNRPFVFRWHEMIEVKHLQKNFVKTVKEPGLKGALRSFIHPKKQTLWRGQGIWPFRCQRGRFEVLSGQMLLGSRPPLKCWQEFWNPHLVFVGWMARFRRTIVKIMSRTLELFLGNEPNYGGIWHCKRLTRFWRRFTMCQTSSSISEWTFWVKSRIWGNLSRILFGLFHWVNGCGRILQLPCFTLPRCSF